MRRVTDPLSVMGADISTSPHGTPPLTIRATQQLTGCDYVMPVASAQVKSCLLLAGLYSVGRTCIKEPAPTRDHTERMLEGFGYPVQRGPERVCMEGGESLQGTSIKVPGDISSAAFFIIGACVAKGSNLRLKDVGVNPTRTGLLEILKRMGANVNVSNRREVGGEPVADIHVRSSRLRGIHVPPDLVPLAIDEFPALFVAAALADGETVVTGAEELRVKESDRIASMAEGLQRLGVQAQATPGGMVIRGGRVEGGRVNSYGDHRVAMAFAMAAMSAQAPIRIDDCANVQTSFPDFVGLSRTCGLQIRTNLDDT
jgi:3-phosphoshikimate 1-carboxyvinyltransferase